MELRELVLSTIEELDARVAVEQTQPPSAKAPAGHKPEGMTEEELRFLKQTRERLEVLFRGLQSPEIKEPEAKLELTLKYLQLLLSDVDQRIEQAG